LSLSQWGMWSDDLDHVQRHQLTQSYILRKRTEAKCLANAIVNAMYGEKEVSSDEMLAMMGFG